MDISPAMTADFAVFDEVLADLNKLITSLDRVTQRQRTCDAKKRPTFDNQNRISGNHGGNIATFTRQDNVGKSRSGENVEDNIVTGQTNGSSSQTYLNISGDNIFNLKKNNRTFSQHDGRRHGFHEPTKRQLGVRGRNDVTEKTVLDPQEPVNNNEYLLNDTGNCILADKCMTKQYTSYKTSRDNSPARLAGGANLEKEKLTNGIFKESGNEIVHIKSSAYAGTDVTTSKGTQNCFDKDTHAEKNTLFCESIPANSQGESTPVVAEPILTTAEESQQCRNETVFYESKEEDNKNRKHQFKLEGSHNRSSSLKRVINWRFAPFKKKSKGAKPKLKSARSLPASSTEKKSDKSSQKSSFHKSKSTSASVRSNKDEGPVSKSLRHKYVKSSKTSNSVEDDTEIVLSSPARFRRAKSFDGHNLLPDRHNFIIQKDPESSDSYFASTEAQSLLCYKRKKNGDDFYKLSSSSRNSTSSDQQSIREKRSLSGSSGTDDRMLFSTTNKSSVPDGANYSRSSSKQGSPKISKPRQLSTSKSLTNLVSMAKTSRIMTSSFGKGDMIQGAHTGYFATKRLQELETFSPQTAAPESENGGVVRGSNNLQRHSLHVMKVQSTSFAPTESTNAKSSKSGNGTSFHSISPPHHLDKNFNITKTGSIKHRFQKSGKSNGKNSSAMTSDEFEKMTERTWNSKGKCVWINMSGQHVKLTNVDLLSLSEIECIALQKVASQTLHDMDLGVSITIPKDESKLINGKNSLLHLHFSTKASRTKAKKHDHVFAIPLVRVVENDQLLRLQTIEQDSSSTSYSNANDVIQDASDSDSLIPSSLGASPKSGRRIPVSPSDQQANLKNVPTSGSPGSDDVDSAFSASSTTSSPRNTTNTVMPVNRTMRRRHAINTGIDEDESQLLKSLSETSTKDKKRSDLIPSTMPQVPYVVQKCCAHIIKHGLDVTGIFRVPGSKKRVKQLREEFDRGVDVRVEDDYLAHDVAALLKEFFRDLPEALLTRELYQAFISTTKLNHADRLSALRCLVWLLPMPNRDTFQQLLSFLATVAEYSEDKTDTNGNTVCGNKMGIPNLSMIFGPNILHRNKKTSSSSNDAQYQVQSLERAEESTLVISVVEDMIRNHKDLFMVPKETHDEILHTLQETDPHALDVLLRRKAVNYSRIETPQSSSEHTSDCGSSDDECTTTIFPVVNNINGNINNNNNNNSKGEYLTFQQHHEKDRLETNSDKQRNSDILLDEESEHKDYEDDVDATLEDEISFNHQTRSISFTEDEIQDILLGDVKINKNSEKSINLKRETRNTTLGDITEVVTSNLAVTDATKVEEPVKVPTPLPRRKRTPQTVNSIQNDIIDSETQTKQSPLNEATNEQMSEKIPQNATPKPLKRRTRSATDQDKIHENDPNNITSQITENTHNRNQKVERLAYVTQVTEQKSRPKFEWHIPNSSEQTGYSRRKGFSVQPEPHSPPQKDEISPAKTKSSHAERRSHIIDDDSTSGIADCDMSFSDSRSVEDLIKESRLILDKIPSHKARHPCHETPHATELHRDHDTTETHVRKRPSALNLRMNRIYGTENSRVLHSVRIPKRASGDKDSRAGSSFHHGAGGRRFSKDDMFFTLEGQKLRNGRHLYINI